MRGRRSPSATREDCLHAVIASAVQGALSRCEVKHLPGYQQTLYDQKLWRCQFAHVVAKHLESLSYEAATEMLKGMK
jgi:hypothetical protein